MPKHTTEGIEDIIRTLSIQLCTQSLMQGKVASDLYKFEAEAEKALNKYITAQQLELLDNIKFRITDNAKIYRNERDMLVTVNEIDKSIAALRSEIKGSK